MQDDLYARGLAVRRKVLGDDHVDRVLAKADRFTMPLQVLETEFVWGLVWSRPGLEIKTRCMLNLAMMAALNRPNELRVQLGAALDNGCTKEEIVEVLLQANAYCGGPAGGDAFRTAREVFAAREQEAR
ncbi:MAG: carboxymuconolactone decarboxylase family protein [Proteobacteria bacterium]|nr:carboxymuconolactone decarboxylase family protein [Pseudomonadota bacterium]